MVKRPKNRDQEKTYKMEIVSAKCWNCESPMKVAIIVHSGEFFGPDRFSKKETEFARSRGVILENHFSKTTNSTYLANTCGQCGEFIGQFFIHEYLYQGEMYDLN